MAHVVDSEKREFIEKQEEIERGNAVRDDAAFQQADHAKYVGHVCNEEFQTGKKLPALSFMRRLRKLNKDIVLVPHPGQKEFPKQLGHTGLLYLRVGDQQIYLFPCESDWMPEWSWMETGEVQRPYVGSAWEKVKVPTKEHRRGWRTVLIRLIEKGLISLDAAEREFGAGDRASWARLKQRSVRTLPI